MELVPVKYYNKDGVKWKRIEKEPQYLGLHADKGELYLINGETLRFKPYTEPYRDGNDDADDDEDGKDKGKDENKSILATESATWHEVVKWVNQENFEFSWRTAGGLWPGDEVKYSLKDDEWYVKYGEVEETDEKRSDGSWETLE